MQAEYLIENEKAIGLEIDSLTAENPQAALEKVLGILKENEELFSHSRAVSACLARLVSLSASEISFDISCSNSLSNRQRSTSES